MGNATKKAIPKTAMNLNILEGFTIDFPPSFDCREDSFWLFLKYGLIIPHIPAVSKTVPIIERKVTIIINDRRIPPWNIDERRGARKIIPRMARNP